MNFKLPRRHRKNFEIISNKKIDENFNENESKKIFEQIKNEYEKAPNSFGSNEGRKESYLELLLIVSDQIAKEYNSIDVKLKHSNFDFETGLQSFENLRIKNQSDRYQYVLPYYNFDKNIPNKTKS